MFRAPNLWLVGQKTESATRKAQGTSIMRLPVFGQSTSARPRAAFRDLNGFNNLKFNPTLAPLLLIVKNRKCQMATIMSDAYTGTRSGIASADEIRTVFTQHKQELTWLAEFLTGNEIMASACVIDARTRTENRNAVSEEWFWTWPRETTIRSALDLERVRIDQLASVYERRDRIHCQHASMSAGTAELLVIEFDAVQLRIDVLCRFVLMLCGVEERSVTETAQLLGISKRAVEGAYCAALDALEVIYSQSILESYGWTGTLN